MDRRSGRPDGLRPLHRLFLHQGQGVDGLVCLSAGLVVVVARYRLYEIDRRAIDLLSSRAMVDGTLAVINPALDWMTVRVLDVGFEVQTELARSVVAVLVVAVAWRPLRTARRPTSSSTSAPRGAPITPSSAWAIAWSPASSPTTSCPRWPTPSPPPSSFPTSPSRSGAANDVTAAAVHGEPQESVIVVPLVHHHEVVGRLTVAALPGERLHAADLRLLRDLASQAGAAAYSVRLNGRSSPFEGTPGDRPRGGVAPRAP